MKKKAPAKKPSKSAPKPKAPSISMKEIAASLEEQDDKVLEDLLTKVQEELEGRVDTKDFDDGDWEAVDTRVNEAGGVPRYEALREVRQAKDDDKGEEDEEESESEDEGEEDDAEDQKDE